MALLLNMLNVGAGPVLAQSYLTQTVESTQPQSGGNFQITFAELGYEERTLASPYGMTEYTLRLPENWQLRSESLLELDFSYTYQDLDLMQSQRLPVIFGELIVALNGQTQTIVQLKQAAADHTRLRIPLAGALLNDTARRTHTIRVTLDADYVCHLPHEARLIIHPTSLLSFDYEQVPITVDLARYPRPFYQRAFDQDQVRFVLPTRPTETELAGAVAVAAKLGDLTYQQVISGATDLEWEAIFKAGEPLREHLVVIGKPDTNMTLLTLAQLGVLPISIRERQLELSNQGPTVIGMGDRVTYTLTLTNTTESALSSLVMVDALPAYMQWVACNPECVANPEDKEVRWTVPLLATGASFQAVLILQAGEIVTDSLVDNTITLLDNADGPSPLNVSTLTATVQTTPQVSTMLRMVVATAAAEGYFFTQDARAVPEHDGIVQELVSPWDPSRAILVITGLTDAAVHKASLAMSSESYFPGLQGSFALVQEVRSPVDVPPKMQAADLTFADLGYTDRLLEGFSQRVDYYFEVPVGWQPGRGTFLNLEFSHSQLINYVSSHLNVSFNGAPVATVPLSAESAANGNLKVELPVARMYQGEGNQITIYSEMYPPEQCSYKNMWLMVNSASLLHVERTEQSSLTLLDLDFYPHPFDLQTDLGDLLFVLPSEPQIDEWTLTLQLAAALGSAAGGSELRPKVTLVTTDLLPETAWREHHLIAIGRPSRNSLIQHINTQLPQPFIPGSDEIEQKLDQVIFRLPADLSLGLVQLLPSPWNDTRALLAVTGTTNDGVAQAAQALINQPWNLKGNLALLKEGTLNTLDTRPSTDNGVVTALARAIPEIAAVATTTPTPMPVSLNPTSMAQTVAPESDAVPTPPWLIPLVGATVVVVIAILSVAFWQSRQHRT
jgi:uncharacterized repeat protein (TIGR01451 family)